MIGKAEIVRIAGQLNLNPHVVEKDYALGWLLAGIFANDKIADSWVFKGGTCLKKCFFETYRFSEDLDFTLTDESHLDDVVNLYRNTEARPTPSVLLDVLRQKCAFKGIDIPKVNDLDAFKNALEAGWEHMLRHQLPALPPVQSFWDVLPEFFSWLEVGLAPEIPASYAAAPGETLLRARTLRLPIAPSLQSHLEVIRFAAANRLCVDLDYQGSTRRIEPYSLRRTKDDNIILHAWNLDRDAHRSYRIDRVQGARTTNQVFTPRYAVELVPSGAVSIPPTQRPSFGGEGHASLGGFSTPGARRRPARRSVSRGLGSRSPSGTTYVYECAYCHKKFRRKKQSTTLNPHKTPDGWPCPGRTGYLVDTKH